MAERKFPDWATDFVADIGNGDPNILEPDAGKKASGWSIEKPLVQFMNWLQGLQSHFIRANNEVKLETDTYEAEAGEIALLDNSSAAVTGFLPANPIDGQWVVFGGKDAFSNNSVIIDGNGNDIMVAADQSVNLDMDYRMFIFYWRGSETMWKINLWAANGSIQE